MKKRLFYTIYFLCFFILPVSAQTEDTSPPKPQSYTPENCLDNAETDEYLLVCMKGIYSTLEAKRIILESSNKHKDFDKNSTIDWPTFYAETLDNSRHFFEEYRKAECTRKEILSSTGFKSKYEKLTCEIRMTKDRINALQ